MLDVKNSFLKLEELMYVSLIGKFDYKHICDTEVYMCFTTTNKEVNSDVKLKPVYITSVKVVSDSISLKRVKAFENKIFSEEFNSFLNRDENSAEKHTVLCYSKRMTDFIKSVYVNADLETQKEILNNYKTNLLNLRKEEIIDNDQLEAAMKFVTNRLQKENEKSA